MLEKNVFKYPDTTPQYKLILAAVAKLSSTIKSNNKNKIISQIETKKPLEAKLNFLLKMAIKIEVKEEEISGVKCYIFNPNGKKTAVFIHGGAFINQATQAHFLFVEKLAGMTNRKIYFPIYPLIPFSNAKDCNTLLLNFLKEIKKNKKLVLIGDSAGGGLCFSLYALMKKNKLNIIDKIIAISPCLDINFTNKKIIDIDDPLLGQTACQIYGSYWRGDLDPDDTLCNQTKLKIPSQIKVVIINGTIDILQPDIELFCETNKNKNIDWFEFEGLHHDFALFPSKEGLVGFNIVSHYL